MQINKTEKREKERERERDRERMGIFLVAYKYYFFPAVETSELKSKV